MYASPRPEPARPSVLHVLLVAGLIAALAVVVAVTVVMVTPKDEVGSDAACAEPPCATAVP